MQNLVRAVSMNNRRRRQDDTRKAALMMKAARAFLGMQSDAVSWASEETTTEFSRVINPDSHFVMGWNVIQSAIILFIAVTLPLRFAELLDEPWMQQVDHFIDVFFMVDLVINFFTGYIGEDGIYVDDPILTTKRYLKSRFVFDLITSVPGSFIPNEGAKLIPFLLKLLRLIRMLKLIKIFQTSLMKDSSINPGIVSLTKLLFGVAFASHLGGCFFWAVKKDDPELDKFILEQNMDTNWEIYVGSVYFAVTTLCTVGYGDILPRTAPERLYCMLLMLCGALVFATILSNISEVIVSLDPTGTAKRNKLTSVDEMCRRMKVRPVLKKKVKNFYEHQFRSTWLESDMKIIEELPANLRLDIGRSMALSIMARHPLFRDIPREFLIRMMKSLRTVKVKSGMAVFREGDMGKSMFIIIYGKVEVTRNREFLMELRAGAVFGESCLLRPRARTSRVDAKEETELLTVTYDDTMKAIAACNDSTLSSKLLMNSRRTREWTEHRDDSEMNVLKHMSSASTMAMVIGSEESSGGLMSPPPDRSNSINNNDLIESKSGGGEKLKNFLGKLRNGASVSPSPPPPMATIAEMNQMRGAGADSPQEFLSFNMNTNNLSSGAIRIITASDANGQSLEAMSTRDKDDEMYGAMPTTAAVLHPLPPLPMEKIAQLSRGVTPPNEREMKIFGGGGSRDNNNNNNNNNHSNNVSFRDRDLDDDDDMSSLGRHSDLTLRANDYGRGNGNGSGNGGGVGSGGNGNGGGMMSYSELQALMELKTALNRTADILGKILERA